MLGVLLLNEQMLLPILRQEATLGLDDYFVGEFEVGCVPVFLGWNVVLNLQLFEADWDALSAQLVGDFALQSTPKTVDEPRGIMIGARRLEVRGRGGPVICGRSTGRRRHCSRVLDLVGAFNSTEAQGVGSPSALHQLDDLGTVEVQGEPHSE